MLVDEQWPIARLIPISSASGIEAQERRAASALLAVLSAVPEFAHSLLRPLGAPKGKIQSFVEVPFKLNGRSIRPDGILVVTKGSKTWSAVVETKVGTMTLETDQMDIYLDLARDLDFNAVLSISNHYVTSSSTYPIEVDRRKLRKTKLHHWSWIDVLTEAVVQKEHRGVKDPDQAYILNELIRYMSDPRSGVLSFEGMGLGWTKVRDGARDNTLRKNDDEVGQVAARWDDLIRYMGLELTKELGRDVRQVISRKEDSPTARLNALRESLASTGELYAELQIPNAASPLRVIADLRSRQVLVSTRIDAPREGRAKGRVSWLLRQLQNAPDDLKVEARFLRGGSSAAPLGQIREEATIIYPEQSKEIRQFELTFTRNMGLKRDASKKSFVDSVISTAEDFYMQVLQNLRSWKATPPMLGKAAPPVQAAEDHRLQGEIGRAIDAAEDEMEARSSPTASPESRS